MSEERLCGGNQEGSRLRQAWALIEERDEAGSPSGRRRFESGCRDCVECSEDAPLRW
ncbi:MAG: hypothetical protein RIS92_3239 [Verrucomicrobiota bacterium]